MQIYILRSKKSFHGQISSHDLSLIPMCSFTAAQILGEEDVRGAARIRREPSLGREEMGSEVRGSGFKSCLLLTASLTSHVPP